MLRVVFVVSDLMLEEGRRSRWACSEGEVNRGYSIVLDSRRCCRNPNRLHCRRRSASSIRSPMLDKTRRMHRFGGGCVDRLW
jgi:hypothetical protein